MLIAEWTNSYDLKCSITRAQIVGWPPVRSYRRNNLQPKKPDTEASGTFVKVSMDGAPYLRKIDLKQYKSYPELLRALEKLFNFSIGKKPRTTMKICKDN